MQEAVSPTVHRIMHMPRAKEIHIVSLQYMLLCTLSVYSGDAGCQASEYAPPCGRIILQWMHFSAPVGSGASIYGTLAGLH